MLPSPVPDTVLCAVEGCTHGAGNPIPIKNVCNHFLRHGLDLTGWASAIDCRRAKNKQPPLDIFHRSYEFQFGGGVYNDFIKSEHEDVQANQSIQQPTNQSTSQQTNQQIN